MTHLKPVVGIDAHNESYPFVFRHWNNTFAGPKLIPSTRAALTKLAKQYPDHAFALEVCSVHEWMMDLFRDQGLNTVAVIPSPQQRPRGQEVGRRCDAAPEETPGRGT